MKKFLFTALMTAMCAMPIQAKLKFGLTGGLNVTSMKFNSDLVSKSNRAGFYVGPTIKLTLPIVGLTVDAAALYDQRDAKVGDESVSQKSINIPINLRYGIGLGSKANIFAFAGPQFGFNIGDKNYSSGLSLNAIQTNWNTVASTFQMKKSNFSINVGIGVGIFSHLEAKATYNIAIGKTGELSTNVWDDAAQVWRSQTSSARTNSWQVGLAYFF